MVDGGGVWSAVPHCRVYAAAEGDGTGSAGSRRLTQAMTEGNVAGSARSRRRKITWMRGTALEALVPAAGTTPRESSTDGVGASGLLTAAICAALLGMLATGTRASSETKRGVPDSTVDGQVGCAVPPSSCQLPVQNVPG